ncbi:hypothetical protein N0V82_000184 [Gnomoniopsis sp. IMI 355080]|nr:hypothetical protein N0V82_000184 [Gnomoniopsis sp. IMI 355080]
MQSNRGRYDSLQPGLREDRSRAQEIRPLRSVRKRHGVVGPAQELLPGSAPDLGLGLLTELAELSLNKRGSGFDLDLNLALALVSPRHPPANRNSQQQRQHLTNIGQARAPNMYGMDEAIQEREALMASLAHISDETKSQCRINVLELFSDMDPHHLSLVCEQGRWNPEDVISQVVNDMEDGKPYPKIQKTNLKRKREDEEDATSPENAAKKWDNVGRRSQFRDAKSSYTRMSHSILQQFFPQMYVENLKSFMALNGGILYPTYLLLSKATAQGDEANPLFKKKKGRVPKNPPFLASVLDERIRDCRDEGEREALEEVRAARIAEHIEADEAAEARHKEQQELENLETAKAEGTITDCGCCFVEFAINRMVHCDGEEVHIGMAKYHLECMSTDGCTGGFARNQREIFLDAKSRIALEQIEMDASIRASGIDNIESCPFCPFAAEYPDLEVNKEFRCLHKDCGIVSCRACRKETHIPKTCEEAALEQGHSARHGIEEAMSEALIRKCNKCAMPFIKENGCNKCYVCSKSCDYSHFNDTRRGGKAGNCDLFDKEGVEARHQAEVKAAEEEAREKVQEEHKDLNPELLKFKESEKIKQDEARKQNLGGIHPARAVPQAMAPGRAEAAPGFPPALNPYDRVAAAHDLPRLPGLARGARQELAMGPALDYVLGAHAGQVQVPAPFAPVAPIPAQALGVAPAPQPHADYGMAQMMHFGPFGNGVLDQAMDLARRSMPPHNYFDVQRPQDAANPNLHRPARVAPENWPLNFPGPGHFGFPSSPSQEPTPLAEPLRQRVPFLPERESPPPGQGRGIRDDPIDLSSPNGHDMFDLNFGEGEVGAARKIWDLEEDNLWRNMLDITKHPGF